MRHAADENLLTALENGEIATRPLRTARQTDTVVLSGKGIETWEPSFTYHGFRYVQIEGWPHRSTTLDGNSVIGIVIHSDMRETGSFHSSPILNRLHDNIRWSMKSNFMGVPTDCPQRDERLGWTGDAHTFSTTANFLYDTSGFWKAWMKDVCSEQVNGRSALLPLAFNPRLSSKDLTLTCYTRSPSSGSPGPPDCIGRPA